MMGCGVCWCSLWWCVCASRRHSILEGDAGPWSRSPRCRGGKKEALDVHSHTHYIRQTHIRPNFHSRQKLANKHLSSGRLRRMTDGTPRPACVVDILEDDQIPQIPRMRHYTYIWYANQPLQGILVDPLQKNPSHKRPNSIFWTAKNMPIAFFPNARTFLSRHYYANYYFHLLLL
jgi:hypothetical protein